MDSSTHQDKKGNPNPSPATRFGGERGNSQSPGGWKKENTISYQYNHFMSMSYAELKLFEKIPDTEKTMAMIIAFKRVAMAGTAKGLADAKEVADRTEGKAPQAVDITSNGETIAPLLVKFMGDD